MNLLNDLIQVGFLHNVEDQLLEARTSLYEGPSDGDLDTEHHDEEPKDLGPRHYGLSKVDRKKMYDSFIETYGIKQILLENKDSEDDILYAEIGFMRFVFSRTLAEIRTIRQACWRLAGDMAVYQSRHRIEGVTFYTLLVDQRYSFNPPAHN